MTDDTLTDVHELARWLLQDKHREPGEAMAIAARFIAELAVCRSDNRDQARHVIDTVSRQLYSVVDEVRADRAAATDER
jgi:hypothetical protein